VWTLPRDVEDPPPISRRAWAIGLAGGAAAAVVIVTVVIPAIGDSKDRTAARERSARAASVARERARLIAEQAAHSARSPAAARLYAAGRTTAARGALRADARAAVGRDARARVAAGALPGPIRDVRCSFDPPAERGPRVHLQCLAVTTTLIQNGRVTARSGHPFLAAGSLRDGRFAWCKENAPPGEGASGTSVFVALPAACTR